MLSHLYADGEMLGLGPGFGPQLDHACSQRYLRKSGADVGLATVPSHRVGRPSAAANAEAVRTHAANCDAGAVHAGHESTEHRVDARNMSPLRRYELRLEREIMTTLFGQGWLSSLGFEGWRPQISLRFQQRGLVPEKLRSPAFANAKGTLASLWCRRPLKGSVFANVATLVGACLVSQKLRSPTRGVPLRPCAFADVGPRGK